MLVHISPQSAGSSFLQNVDEQRSQRRGNQDGAIRAPPVTRLRAELDVREKLVHAKHAERDLNDAKSKKKKTNKKQYFLANQQLTTYG